MPNRLYMGFIPRWMKPEFLKRSLLWLCVRMGIRVPVSYRVRYHLFDRSQYAFGMYAAARQARALGLREMSCIEFGVAGGNGLIAMERIAEAVERDMGVRVAVYGFDRKDGLPKPVDYRDMPYIWKEGYFVMDEEKLRARLSRAELVLGDVKDTLPAFMRRTDIPPIGFVAFDLDLYSATREALRIFEARADNRYLPRPMAYFDDILTYVMEAHCEYVGELRAIREFNEDHEDRKVCPLNGLGKTMYLPALWSELIYACHLFEHPRYGVHVLDDQQEQLPLA